MPDRPLDDNQVVIPLLSGRHGAHDLYSGDTSGKIEIIYTFALRHVFRRNNLDRNLKTAYTFIQPWLSFFTALPNQTLGGIGRLMNVTRISITQSGQGGQPIVVLSFEFEVATEFAPSYT